MKKTFLFFVITAAFISTAYSQVTSTEEINKRILKDSAVYSWEQANEFVNGLQNEARLRTAYSILKIENESILQAYQVSSTRNKRFKDSIIPNLEAQINIKRGEVELNRGFIDKLEYSLKRQKRKKYQYGAIGAGAGILLALLLMK